MPTKMLMPLLGESVTEATVTMWLKSTGDKVEEYDPILEVNTDKVDTEIPSPTSGVILATLSQEGEVVKVGALLGWIGQPGEDIPVENAPGQSTTVSPPTTPSALSSVRPSLRPVPTRELGFISPVVAKIAAEQNVELSKVPGTGMGGRITKKDLESFLASGMQATTPVTVPAPTVPPTVGIPPAGAY